MTNKINLNLYPLIFNFLTLSGFSALFISYIYDFKLAVLSTTLILFCGIKFICIFVTLIRGTVLLSIAALIALAVLQPIVVNTTFISLILISIIAEYAAISISIQKLGIDEKLSNLNPMRMLQIKMVSAVFVAFALVCGLSLLESPTSSELFVFGLKAVVIEFLGPLLVFRALSLFR